MGEERMSRINREVDLISRYAAGNRAWDNLYAEGRRCPSNPDGARCRCLVAEKKICVIWKRLTELEKEIGMRKPVFTEME